VLSVSIVSGRCDLMAEVLVDSNKGLVKFLTEQLSPVKGITHSESFLMLKHYRKFLPKARRIAACCTCRFLCLSSVKKAQNHGLWAAQTFGSMAVCKVKNRLIGDFEGFMREAQQTDRLDSSSPCSQSPEYAKVFP
jgi:hypothetical protein